MFRHRSFAAPKKAAQRGYIVPSCKSSRNHSLTVAARKSLLLTRVPGLGQDVQEPAAVDDLCPFMAWRKVPGIASHEIVGLGNFGAFQESIVGFVG
jgi:hypothetical protein